MKTDKSRTRRAAPLPKRRAKRAKTPFGPRAISALARTNSSRLQRNSRRTSPRPRCPRRRRLLRPRRRRRRRSSSTAACAPARRSPSRRATSSLSARSDRGAEIIAGGSIHVYGALRGRAIAGAAGDGTARIFCQDLDAELLSIMAIIGLRRTSTARCAAARSRRGSTACGWHCPPSTAASSPTPYPRPTGRADGPLPPRRETREAAHPAQPRAGRRSLGLGHAPPSTGSARSRRRCGAAGGPRPPPIGCDGRSPLPGCRAGRKGRGRPAGGPPRGGNARTAAPARSGQ